jgi:RNase P/RNase MRP subunit POP5
MVRLKHRYVLGQILLDPAGSQSGNGVHSRDVLAAVKEKVQTLYGDVGAGQFGASMAVKYIDEDSLIFVLRTSRESETETRYAMSTVDTLKGSSVSLRALGVCGSARTAITELSDLMYSASDGNVAGGKGMTRQQVEEDLLNSIEL